MVITSNSISVVCIGELIICLTLPVVVILWPNKTVRSLIYVVSKHDEKLSSLISCFFLNRRNKNKQEL